MLKKLTSRKFIISIVSIICGLLSLANVNDSAVSEIGSILMAVLPSVTYIITEGKIDREAVGKTIRDVADIIDDKNK